MNSQYMSQQPPQYGAPPEPGYGPPQSGSGYGPPQSSNKQMPVLNQAGFQQQQPQQQQLQQQSLQMMGPQRGTTPNSTVRGNLPPAALPNTHTVPNGPAQGPPPLQSVHGMQGLQSQHGLANNLASQGLHGPTNLQGSVGAPNNQSGQFPPSQQRGSQNMPAPPPASASPNQIASQMAGMNISGPRRMNSGLPITSGKPGLVSPNIPSNSFPGAINGGPTPVQGLLAEAPPVQKSHPPGSKQYVNGSTGPSPASAGGLPMPPNGAPPTGSPASQDPGIVMPPHFSGPQSGIMTSQLGSMPPQQSNMPPHQGNMPPHPGSMPPHPGSMPLHPGNMPPHPGNMPPHPGNMPPHPGNIPPHPGNMPPQPGNMPPHPSGLPPPPGTMLPQHLGGMPPHSAGITPHSSGLSSQIGGMPPPRGSVPPQGATMPTQGGIMPPPPGSMIGMPHPGGQLQGNLPPPPGRMPFSQTGAPQSMDSYQGSIAAPPGPGGGYGSPQQPLGSSQMQSHTYSQLPSQPAHPNMQAQQARRLDPDQMPSPIQVTQDDQRNRSGIFSTGQKGQVPPLVTTDFVTQDQGNAGPRYIRSTMYNIPATIDMMKQTAVPLGLVLSPLARTVEGEYSPPIVDMGELGPVRCIRCKAYMCPFMQFIDGGRRFHCLFCKATTEVPAEYFQHLDHTGQRVDRFERPELMLGTYEFVATKDYCRNNTFPKPPALIFLIDVSYNNIKSGMVHLLCKQMKEILKLLPKDAGAEKSTMRVGFITYNNTVHFYNIKGCLAQPQMMVVGDVQDMFMPLLEGFLCDPVESEAVIDSLMDQIPAMFADTRETETVLAPAIQAGLEALKASECAGKLLVFLSSLPIAEAPGKLKNRDERKLLGTEKEKTVLAPQINTYNTLGQDCVGAGCSVDLFVFNNSYIDIATIGQVCRLTGGEIFKYTYFQADLDGERLISDIKRNVSRPIAFDAIMRVRTSTGVRATDFFGHFFMSNTTDMELASVDCDKAVAVEIKHDDKLTEEDGVYVQVALLYTSCGGQRRLRVLNLSFKTCTQMADLYRSCDLDSIVNFFSKQVVFRLLETSPKQVKDGLVNRCAQMLACYRKNCASPSSAGQLILPECMKLLPLYVNCILKSDAVSGGSDMTIDDRSFVMQAVSIMDLPSSVAYFYPRLLPLHDIDVNGNEIPAPVRCTADKIHDDGVYLLENGVHMFLWIGLNVGMDWVQNVFGVHSAAQIDIDRTALPALDNPLSQRINSLISSVRQQRHRSMRLTLVRQRDKLEMVFKHFLVEDRGFDGSASYVDFLCHMHKEIRNLLS